MVAFMNLHCAELSLLYFLFSFSFLNLFIMFCQASFCPSVVLYLQWYLKPRFESHANLMNMLTASFFQIINDGVNPGQT